MLSGIINIRNRSLPLTWSGQTAEHLADGHWDTPSLHPYMHVQAQQFARKGKIFHKRAKNYFSFCANPGGGWVVVPLLLSGNFVIVRSCYVENHSALDTLKKQKGVGSAKSKSKAKVKWSALQFSDDVIAATEAIGVSKKELQQCFADMLNGKQPLNKKR